MANPLERFQGTRRKRKNYDLEVVPKNEKLRGTSDKDLGAAWGLPQGESKEVGRVTRGGTQTQSVPGGPEATQETSLDQPVETGSDRQDLDQLAEASGDRLNTTGLDQSGSPDGDRPKEPEPGEPSSSKRQLSNATEKSPESEREKDTPVEDDWKQVPKSRARNSRETSEVEEKLFIPDSDDANYGRKHFPSWLNDVENKKNDENPKENKSDEDSEPDKTSEEKKSVRKKHRKGNSQTRKEVSEGKRPMRPIGFREVISSISRAGGG